MESNERDTVTASILANMDELVNISYQLKELTDKVELTFFAPSPKEESPEKDSSPEGFEERINHSIRVILNRLEIANQLLKRL